MATKAKQIKLSRYEEDNIDCQDENIIYLDKKTLMLGEVKPTRLRQLTGVKKFYYVLEFDNKTGNYKVLRKTHKPEIAQFTLCNAMTFDLFQDAFKALSGKDSKRNVIDLEVKNPRNNRRQNRRNRWQNDVILKSIYECDYHIYDDDDSQTIAAKKALASVRPKDYEVVIYPEHYDVDSFMLY